MRLDIPLATLMPPLAQQQMATLNLEEGMRSFLSLLYVKLMENIRLQLAQRQQQQQLVQVSGDEMSVARKPGDEIDWDELSRQVLARLVQVAKGCQGKKFSNEAPRMRPAYKETVL